MTEDRRKRVRAKVRLSARCTSETGAFDSTITSLSDAGVFISRMDLEPVGTILRLTFGLDSHEIACTGEVIYHGFQDGLRGMGIRFLRLTDEDREQVRRTLSRAREGAGSVSSSPPGLVSDPSRM